MDTDQTSQLQALLDRIRCGDTTAYKELVGCAYERFRLLARTMLHQDFPRLERLHGTNSVVHEMVAQLFGALREVQPQNVRHFFNLATMRMRWVLLEMARKARLEPEGLVGCSGSSGSQNQPIVAEITTSDPANLAAWTEFHRKVEELPQAHREVFELIWYHGLSQADVAKLLDVHPKAISLRWIAARLALADSLPIVKNHTV
jgi:RNA polymerase sigma factor (sigma-70 family)